MASQKTPTDEESFKKFQNPHLDPDPDYLKGGQRHCGDVPCVQVLSRKVLLFLRYRSTQMGVIAIPSFPSGDEGYKKGPLSSTHSVYSQSHWSSFSPGTTASDWTEVHGGTPSYLTIHWVFLLWLHLNTYIFTACLSIKWKRVKSILALYDSIFLKVLETFLIQLYKADILIITLDCHQSPLLIWLDSECQCTVCFVRTHPHPPLMELTVSPLEANTLTWYLHMN